MIGTLLASATRHLENMTAWTLSPWKIRKNQQELAAAISDLMMILRYLNEPMPYYVAGSGVKSQGAGVDLEQLLQASVKQKAASTGTQAKAASTGQYL